MEDKKKDEYIDKILAKIPTDKVYEDLLQPGLKKVGEALSNVFDLGNLIMLPFKLVNERSRIYLKHNLEKYAKKLEKIDEKELCQVSDQIGLPIIDKLTTLNTEELSSVFINLLTKASSTKTLYLVHPSFFNILNNLSQDEAIILFANKGCNDIPFIDINLEKKISTIPRPNHLDEKRPKTKVELNESIEYNTGLQYISIRAAYNLTGLEKRMQLYFPQNIDVYIENLYRSGVIEFERNQYDINNEDKYETLINNVYKDLIVNYQTQIADYKDEKISLRITTSKCIMKFTEFGKAFINAVVKDIEELGTEGEKKF